MLPPSARSGKMREETVKNETSDSATTEVTREDHEKIVATLEKIDVAAQNVTSCAFGGPDLTDLYITSARASGEKEDLAYPHGGGLFVARPGVKGVPASVFAG